MSRGGIIGGPAWSASSQGRWGVEDTQAKTNLGVGVEEFLVVKAQGDFSFYAFPGYQQVNLGIEKVNSNFYGTMLGSCVFSADGRFMACTESPPQTLHVWNMRTGVRTAWKLAWQPMFIAFIPGTNTLAVGRNGSSSLWLLNVSTGDISGFATGVWNPGGMTFSPDGTKVALAYDAPYVVRVFNLANGNLITTFAFNNYVRAVAWSPDGTKLAIGGAFTSFLKVCTNTVSWAAYATIPNPPAGQVFGLSWSPDSSTLAAAASYTTWGVNTYNSETWAVTRPSVQYPSNNTSGVSFSPSGKWIAMHSFDNWYYGAPLPLSVYRAADLFCLGGPKNPPMRGNAYGVAWWNPKLMKAS